MNKRTRHDYLNKGEYGFKCFLWIQGDRLGNNLRPHMSMCLGGLGPQFTFSYFLQVCTSYYAL